MPNPATGLLSVERPIVPIRLGYHGVELVARHYRAMIDSGADWCLFHSGVARLLGIPLQAGEMRQFQGVGRETNTCYFHPVRLFVGPFHVDIRAGFTEALGFPYGLLGQSGFFDHFLVTFNAVSAARYVEVNPLQ